jgi:hypothetical protein
MGSGKPRPNVERASAAAAGGASSGGDVIRCEIEATVAVTLLTKPAEPMMTGSLAGRDSKIVVMDGDTVVAVLDPGGVVDRLRLCLRQGFEYTATLNISTGAPVASVKPRP